MTRTTASPFPRTRWVPGRPPGVYEETLRTSARPVVRMDVVAFIGLCERGPVYEPVVLDSWLDFIRRFGAAGGGRLLAQDVALFFANGGRRCVVVRVVDPAAARPTRWVVPGLLGAEGHVPLVFARDPGAWGDRIVLRTHVRSGLVPVRLRLPLAARPDELSPGETVLIAEGLADVPAGTLLRLREGGGNEHLVFVVETRSLGAMAGDSTARRMWVLDAGGHALVDSGGVWQRAARAALPPTVDSVLEDGKAYLSDTAVVWVDAEVELDGAVERYPESGLHPRHPAFLLRRILGGLPEPFDLSEFRTNEAGLADVLDELRLHPVTADEEAEPPSLFLRPDLESVTRPLLPGAPASAGPLRGRSEASALLADDEGQDGNLTTDRHHFLASPQSARATSVALGRVPVTEDGGQSRYDYLDRHGAIALLEAHDERHETEPVSFVRLPDLFHPEEMRNAEVFLDVPPDGGARFGDCGLTAESSDPAESPYPLLEEFDEVELRNAMRALVEACATATGWIALLDLPPGLASGQIHDWRLTLASDRAALYAPYLRVAPVEDSSAPLRLAPPGGAAAGLAARRSRTIGVHAAPAGERLESVLGLDPAATLPPAGVLHDLRVNAIHPRSDGFHLLGARTTSLDAEWSQANVRRVIDYLARQLTIDSRWAVFEPNDPALWARLRVTSLRRLRGLHDRGAFAGGSPETSYFVACDARTNPEEARDVGQVIVEVGVAVAHPAEFIVFRLVLHRDGEEAVLQS